MRREIEQRYQAEAIMQARLRIADFAPNHSLDELLQFILDDFEVLTGSSIGFFHFLEADQKTLWLQAWSSNTLQRMCSAEGKDRHYDIEHAGVWADAVRQRRAILHNDYAALPEKRGMPEGHARVTRELVVPILREQQVVAILGMGNKAQDYTANDAGVISTLADFAWDVIQHKRAETALRQNEEKFRTLADWTYDWEKWLDPQSYILYSSPSCERITGYSPAEFIADPDLLVHIVHPDDRQFYIDHQQIVHDSTTGPVSIDYRIIARDGSERWIEHLCRPLFGPDGRYLGRRVSNREITERKRAEKLIAEQNRREILLNRTIQNIQTDIARDLHDTLGQNISYLRLSLDHIAGRQVGDMPDLQEMVQNMAWAANESYDLIRAMLTLLQEEYSDDPLHLFTRYVEQIARRSDLQIDLNSQGQGRQLTPHQTRQLFYIFREALNNLEKYAQASHVTVEFHWGEQALTFTIVDDGRGFDSNLELSPSHYGLKFMRERAEILGGACQVNSAPGQGTTIQVSIPYEIELAPAL
jgi:PAS domain S-box-containing protein